MVRFPTRPLKQQASVPRVKAKQPGGRSRLNANSTLASNSVPWQPSRKNTAPNFIPRTLICYTAAEVIFWLAIDSLFNTMTMSIRSLLILAGAVIVAADQHIADSPFLNQYIVDSGYVTISTAGSVSSDLDALGQKRCVLIKRSRMPPTPPTLPNATTAVPMFARCLVPVQPLSRAHLMLGAHTPIRRNLCEWRLLLGRVGTGRRGPMTLMLSQLLVCWVYVYQRWIFGSLHCISVGPKWNVCGHIIAYGKPAGICSCTGV